MMKNEWLRYLTRIIRREEQPKVFESVSKFDDLELSVAKDLEAQGKDPQRHKKEIKLKAREAQESWLND